MSPFTITDSNHSSVNLSPVVSRLPFHTSQVSADFFSFSFFVPFIAWCICSVCQFVIEISQSKFVSFLFDIPFIQLARISVANGLECVFDINDGKEETIAHFDLSCHCSWACARVCVYSVADVRRKPQRNYCIHSLLHCWLCHFSQSSSSTIFQINGDFVDRMCVWSVFARWRKCWISRTGPPWLVERVRVAKTRKINNSTNDKRL